MNIGIDFGTTNSSIAYQRAPHAVPECASVDQHINIPFDVALRTAVLLDQFGKQVPNGVGAVALDPMYWFDSKTRAPRRVLQDLKPFLKTFRLRDYQVVERTVIDDAAYDHLYQEPGSTTIRDRIETGDARCSREELLDAAAAVFRTLFAKTPASVKQPKPRIVIGVPLIFPDYAKKRLLDIIVRSGVCGRDEPFREALRRVRFIPEPIGASLLYAMECEPPRGRSSGRVLIFDSGGGTLDLALLEFATIDGKYRPVQQLALDSRILAGRRFDECIERGGLEQYRDKVLQWNRDKANAGEVTRWQLAQAAESIKLSLSTHDEHEELSLIGAGVRPRVTRSEFEEWADPLLVETESLIRATVGALDEVDTVVMVGGSSLIPCVQRLVRSLFPSANVVHEDPRQSARGDGVERALTAVSKGLALYDEAAGAEGVTTFAYGFWDMVTNQVVEAAPKWSNHDDTRPIAKVRVPPKAPAITLTLVQELVQPERVLNVVNVPVIGDAANRTHVHARVRTSDGSLYPDIELIDPRTGAVHETLVMSELSESVLRALIEHEDHVLRWRGRAQSGGADTPYPEVVTLRRNDLVCFRTRNPDGSCHACRQAVITRIDRISDGLPYPEVGHWDLTRWRFYVALSDTAYTVFAPAHLTDLRLAPHDSKGCKKCRRKL